MSEGVGYKRPPRAAQWKKGQSGNPTGRKKGSLNLKSDLLAELAEVISINEGGASRRITKQRALLKSLAARAIQGDARASNLLLNLVLRLIEPDAEPLDGVDGDSSEDQAILESFLKRKQSRGSDT